jgi:hypothetical protein
LHAGGIDAGDRAGERAARRGGIQPALHGEPVGGQLTRDVVDRPADVVARHQDDALGLALLGGLRGRRRRVPGQGLEQGDGDPRTGQ